MHTSALAAVVAIAFAAVVAAVPGHAQQPAANPLDKVPDTLPFDVPYGAPIALDRAQQAIAAATAACRGHDWKMAVAVVDSGANLVALARMDGTMLAAAAIAEHKARAAALFRRDTKAFEGGVNAGTASLLTLDGMTASRAGIPLIEDGKLIGAIGVSGGTGSQDEICAKAGAAVVNK